MSPSAHRVCRPRARPTARARPQIARVTRGVLFPPRRPRARDARSREPVDEPVGRFDGNSDFSFSDTFARDGGVARRDARRTMIATAALIAWLIAWLAIVFTRRRRRARDERGSSPSRWTSESEHRSAPEKASEAMPRVDAREIAKSMHGRLPRASAPARMLDKKRDVMAKVSGHGPPPPPVSRWNQRPLYMTIPSYAGCKITRGALTYNSEIPFEFETSVFAGRCLIRFRDCPPPPDGAAPDAARRLEEYFRGRARTFQCVVQGRFKRRVRADEAVTGHEFFQPLVGIPGKRFVKTLVHILRAMNPSLQMSLFARRPQVWTFLGASAQVISIDAPGDEPDITRGSFEENNSKFDGAFASGRLTSAQRRRLLADVKKVKQYSFSTDDVYTFDFYQHVFDPKTFTLNVFGLDAFRVDVARHVGAQPPQIMARTSQPGEYLFCFCMWHERALARETNDERRSRAHKPPSPPASPRNPRGASSKLRL